MTRQVTDQLYIELDYYYPEEYYVYTAEAESIQSNEFTLSAQVGILTDAQASLTVEITVAVTISHIEGSDLFAFSEAAINVIVERIRDNNVAVSTVFSTNIDAVRYRDITGDESSAFSLEAVNQRSRNATMAAQAAFSFDSTGSRIRFADADTNVAASLTATISHIEGADIVVENFATLTATANYTVDNASSISTQASVAAIATVAVDSVFVNITNNFVFFVSRYAGEGRPKNIVRFSGGVESPVVIDTTYKKFGTGSVRPVLPNGSPISLRSSSSTLNTTTLLPKFEESYAFETWFYVNSATDRAYTGFGLGLSSLSSDWFIEFETLRRITLHTEESALEKITGQNIYNNNTWNHLLLIAEPGTPFVEGEIPPQRIALFLNGIRILTQTRTDFRSRTHPYDFFTIRGDTNADYFYFDEISYWRGTTLGYSIDSTTITVPTAPRSNSATNLKFLWHVDADGSDDVGLTQTFASNLQSVSSVTSSISGPQRYSADLSSEFALSAQASVDRGADLTAFATGSLELDAVRVRFGDSAASAEVTVSAESVKITEVTADLVAECAVSADVSRTRDNEIATDSIATQIAVVAKTGNTLVDVNVVSTVTASATLTADRTSSITSNADFAVINQRIRDAVSDQTAQSTLSADALRVKQIAADVSSEAQIMAVAVKTVDADTSIISAFELDIDTSGIKQGISLVFSLGTLDISETLFKNFDSEISAVFSQNTATEDSLNKRGEAQLSSSTSLSADFVRTRDVYIGYAGDRTAKTVNAQGNAQISTAQAKFGAGSALITDTGDYFTISGDSTLYNGNFTVELFLWGSNLTQTPNGTIWDNRTSSANGMYLYVSYGSIGLYEGITGKGLTSAGFNNSQWNHIALVRNGTNAKVFVNGVQKISATVTTTNYSNRTTYIGTAYNGLVPMRGYYDEVRLSASARYLSGFTPTTSAYVNDSETSALLHLDTDFSDDIAAVPGPEIESTVSATNGRIREANIDIDGVFSDSILAAKAATGLVEITVTAAQSTTAQKTTDIDSDLLVISNFQADGTTNIIGESDIIATVTMSVDAVKTASAVSISQAQASVTAEVSRIRPFAVLVFSLGDLSATAERSRDTTADIAAENTVTANVGKIIQAECDFGSLFSPSVSIRKIFINIYVYRIPREDRTYRIKAETRRHVIPEETRIYNIRR